MGKLRQWNFLEPARVRAVYTALVALAIALGITIPSHVDNVMTATIGLLAVLIPVLQGEVTRAVVTPSRIATETVVDYVAEDDAESAADLDPDVLAAETTDAADAAALGQLNNHEG
jgi:hypothetical protein